MLFRGRPITAGVERVMDFASPTEVEQFFNRARFDRSQTPLLKAELDRLGLFKQYEDRFLDLFRDLS